MASLAHRAKVRRAERSVFLHTGSINLVPLVDILTSIVFFSLLTYTGEQLLRLTSYDLELPPQVVTAEQATSGTVDRALNLLLAVRVEQNRLIVEHSEEGGFRQEIPGTDSTALGILQGLMSQIKERYPQNASVLVVPADEVNYDNVIDVLERLRLANYRGISLGSKARGTTTTASAGEVTR